MGEDIRLCGAVTVDGDASALAGRLALLLAVLVVRGEHGVRRAELVDVLWPRDPPAAPSTVLNPMLSRLRRIVGPVDGRGLVRLVPAPGQRIDVRDALADLVVAQGALDGEPAAALTAAERAADTLAQELLPAHEDPWTLAQRVRLAARCAEARTVVARAGLALGGDGLAPAETAARALVAAQPLHETAVALLVDVLAARGEHVAALRVYEELRVGLRAELGAAPGRRLRTRHEELLLDAGVAGPTATGPTTPLAAERSGRLVGRADELAAITAAVERREGPRLLLVTGPPGIGKTRLAAEVAARCHAAGAVVLLGRGYAAPTGPYAAIAEALAPAVAHADPDGLAVALGPLVGELARLVPMLARHPPVGAASGAGADPDTDRFRMFEAVRALLAELDGPAGTLLVLDDAHWLDSSSAPLVAHLLRAPDLPGLAILATARPHRPGTPDPVATLRHAAADACDTTALGALDLAAVRNLVAVARPADEVDETAERLLEATGGSPLLLRAALAAGPAAEADLGAAVRAGLDWVGPDVAALLEVLAVDGGRAGLDVLAAASGTTLEVAGDRLERARDAGLLVASGGPSGLAAMHDAVRQAMLAALGPARRAALHVRLATAYETVCADHLDLVLPELATHWSGADGRVAAAHAAAYGERAAHRALAALAYEQAAAHAAAAREQHARAGGDPEGRLALLLLEGEALNRASALGPARAVLTEALVLARQLGRDDLVARAAIDHVGHRLGAGIQDPELIAVLEEGWSVAPEDDLPLRARLAGGLAATLLRGPADRRDVLAAEAVALAEAAGDPGALAETLLWQHVGMLWRGDPEARGAVVDAAEVAARAAARPGLVLHARMLRFTDLLEAGRVADARAEIDVWTVEADATRVPYHRWAAAICRPTLDLLAGRLDAARTALQRAHVLAEPLGEDRIVLAAHTGQWFTLRLVEGAAAESATQLAAVIATQDVPVAWHAGLAWCRALDGDRDRARADVVRIVEAGLDGIVDPNRLTALSFLAQAGVVAGAPPPVLDAMHAALAPHAGHWIVQHYGGALHAPVRARLALLDVACGRLDDAQAHLEAASAAVEAVGAAGVRPDLDHVRVRLALAHGEPAGAAALARTGIARARRLGLVGPAMAIASAGA